MIRTLIKKHSPTLEQFGGLLRVETNPTKQGGRPGTEFHLNRKQAIYLTTQAGTPKARAITVLVVAPVQSRPSGQRPVVEAPEDCRGILTQAVACAPSPRPSGVGRLIARARSNEPCLSAFGADRSCSDPSSA